jgi:Protein of unknown function (DUF2865)
MLRSCRTSHVRAICKPPVVVLLPLFVATLIVLTANVAAFAGYFDFFFGGFGARPQPMAPSWYSNPTGHIVKPRVSITVRPAVRSSDIEYTSYCVRLCDGRYFPLNRSASPERICEAMCPASETKIFSGGTISDATSADGRTYQKLANAFAYRDQIVPDCTCNGRDSFGVAALKLEDDPTLQADDLISTPKGLVPFRVWRKNQNFTPLEKTSLVAPLPANQRNSEIGSPRQHMRRATVPTAVMPTPIAPAAQQWW